MNQLAPPVDLSQLQTFYEVARLGSVRRAAEVLHCSQPAVSHRLRALQEDLGVALFERVGRTLALTAAGDRLRHQCQDLFALSQNIRDAVRADSETIHGTVTIGTYPTVSSQLLVPALHQLLVEHRALQVTLKLGFTEPLCDELRSGNADILLLIGAERHPGLQMKTVGRDALVAVMSPTLAPRRRGQVSPEELRNLRYLCWSGPRDPTFEAAQGYAQRHGLLTERSPLVPHTETLRALAVAGAGYTILPSYTARAEVQAGHLVALAPKGLKHRLSFQLITRRGQVVTAALRAVEQALIGLQFDISRRPRQPATRRT
ncbi:MAG: LysR family transcriptional regulator [Myxococcales bacterium]|nr:LysR family transcriptional regulator [Myxococcales bacterium]